MDTQILFVNVEHVEHVVDADVVDVVVVNVAFHRHLDDEFAAVRS